MKRRLLTLMICSACFIYNVSRAQDNLLEALMDSTSNAREPVTATFKSSRIINLQSNETVAGRVLDFRVAHRFGAIGAKSGGNRHNFYGLDESTDIRVAFEYGITNRITAGVAHHKYDESYEVMGKFRLLEQTSDNHIPFAVTVFANTAYSDEENPLLEFDSAASNVIFLRRMAYSAQVIIARKFSPGFSFEIAPTLVHRNFIENDNDDNTVYAIGAGGRIKITRSLALIADYMFSLGDFRKPGNENGFYNALGAGLEIETGGHVFSMMFTNAAAIIENRFVTETMDTWTKGGFRFSFNISRSFKL